MQLSLAELITDRDEEALELLTDVRIKYLAKPGFRIIFELAPNGSFDKSAFLIVATILNIFSSRHC